MPENPLLTIASLRVEANGQPILAVSELTLSRGEVLVLLGPNGAGKSTLLQTLAFLRTPQAGVLQFEGQPVHWRTPPLSIRRRIAVVFQEPLLFDTTVEENVASGLKLRRVTKTAARERVALWLERFGILHLASRQARTLSGGEAQRTSLARAFVLEPDLLLLDEPFSALDPPTRETLTETFHRIQRQTQVTTLFVTHDRLEALRLGDRIAVMDHGEILQIGTPEEVFSQPANAMVANFVGIETILRGCIESQAGGFAEVYVGVGASIAVATNLSAGVEVTLCIRPEEVTLLAASSDTAPSSARNHFVARVTRLLPWGIAFKVHLDCGFPLVAFVTRPSVDILDLHEGQTVLATFKATAVHIITT
jgi:tungstate transport system ATP-binding protein